MPALSPTEHLTDGVVTLRPWAPADAPARTQAFRDPEIVRWTDLPADYSEADAAADIQRGYDRLAAGDRATFAIIDRSGAVIGGIDLMLGVYERAELGYVIAAPARRQGNATRAVQLLSAWALAQPGIERVELPVPIGNIPSAGVANRAGFTPEGRLRSYLALRDGGPRYDVTMFALVADSAT